MNYQHILFDLDGTLINSAPAIVASYEAAFAACKLQPARRIDESIIGPPLLETLHELSPSADEATLSALASAFKHSYDGGSYRHTEAYAGIAELLASLHAAGLDLAIATNKRLHPTELILQHLGWRELFSAVHALDMVEPRLPHKAAMLERLLRMQHIDPRTAVYIGDRAEDGQASDANQLTFIAAGWGYGSLARSALRPHWQYAEAPANLLELLAER